MSHESILKEVELELARAVKAHGSMKSAHDGYAVILEELDELWDEVKANPGRDDYQIKLRILRMRSEAIQVAAMAVRFVKDVCDSLLPPEVK